MTQRSRYHVHQFALGLITLAAIGCGANLPEPRDSRAAGEWQARLPSTQSPFGELAYGRGGNSARTADDDQPLMAAQPLPKARPVKHVAPKRAPEQQAALALAMPELPAASEPAPAAAPVQLAQADLGAEQRYATREAQSEKLDQYRGGDAIVISAGALVVVLLIVILILLLR